MFYSAVESKVMFNLAFLLADLFAKSRNLNFSFFQTGELLTFRKPQTSIIGDSDFQFSSHRAILPIYVSKES